MHGSTLGRLRQEDHKFEASLDYIVSSRLAWATHTARSCLRKEKHKSSGDGCHEGL
jgi:hypothetical protein